jgi:CheY-like chemotaxis protein
MGGDIQVQSRMGSGSEFYFEIAMPVAQPDGVDDALLLPEIGQHKPLRVLLVDDNLTALQLLADICRSLGWVVDVASNGSQALALLGRSIEQQKAYDLAIVDDQMPGMNGWETVRLIRQREQQPPCHVLMITASGRHIWEGRSGAEREWVNGVLVKPVTASTLFDAVVRHPGASLDQHFKKTLQGRQRRLVGMRLLVVEDNAINQQVASELLAAEGASVTLAADGAQGVRAVLQSEMPFDAVLMDMEMPVMDGISATRELRHVHDLKDLVIIAMTANAMESDRQACLVAGMNAHVSKPLDMEQLVKTLLQYAPAGFLHKDILVSAEEDFDEWHTLPKTDASQRFISSTVVDIDAALERLGGESDVYVELIEPFIEDSTHMLLEIKNGLISGEGQEVCRCLHTLKGVAATMGANELSALARQLESLVKAQVTTNNPPYVPPEDMAALEAALVAVHDALHLVLQQAEQTIQGMFRPVAGEANMEIDLQLRDQLKHFADLLRNADLTALSLHRELQQHHADILHPHAQLLAQSIHEFDFGRAATLCDALLANLTLKGDK